MNIKKSRLHKIAATATAFCVAFTQVAIAAPAFSVSTHEVSLPDTLLLDRAMQISVPSAVATIDKLIPGNGKTIFHIQTAHGQYQAEKQIEALLTHLEKSYGVETLLMEGASQPLDPEIINFFPEDRKSTLEAVDAFVRHSVVSGPEVFLLNSGKARGLGIEDEAAYEQNLQDFAAVISARDSSSQFLSDLEQGIERLAALYLSSDARSFLKQVERKETGDVPFDIYLQQLKLAAEKHAGINLTDASWQLLWPMLTRVFAIEKLEKKIDAAAFKKQKEDFLKAVKPSLSREIYSEVEKLLNLKDLSAKLPDPATSALFESLVRSLPDDFNYDRFSSVTAFCGLLMLKSQLNVETLSDEIGRLEDKIADKLAETKNAKDLVSVLKDYRLLKKLFALELLPTDFDKLSSASIQPSQIIEKLKSINGNARAKEITFANSNELNALYDKAVRFYEGARDRDTQMLRRIEERLGETGADKVAVVTGGFHSGPFAKYFEERGYSYALMTPKLTTIDAQGRQNYLDVMQMWASVPKSVTTESGAEIVASTIYPPQVTAHSRGASLLGQFFARLLPKNLWDRLSQSWQMKYAAVAMSATVSAGTTTFAQAPASPTAPAPIVAPAKIPVAAIPADQQAVAKSIVNNLNIRTPDFVAESDKLTSLQRREIEKRKTIIATKLEDLKTTDDANWGARLFMSVLDIAFRDSEDIGVRKKALEVLTGFYRKHSLPDSGVTDQIAPKATAELKFRYPDNTGALNEPRIDLIRQISITAKDPAITRPAERILKLDSQEKKAAEAAMIEDRRKETRLALDSLISGTEYTNARATLRLMLLDENTPQTVRDEVLRLFEVFSKGLPKGYPMGQSILTVYASLVREYITHTTDRTKLEAVKGYFEGYMKNTYEKSGLKNTLLQPQRTLIEGTPALIDAAIAKARSEARRTYEVAYVESLFSNVARLDAAITSFVKGQAGEYWSRFVLNPKDGAGVPAIVVENKAGSFADQLMAAAKAAGVADMPFAEFAAYAVANYASFELTTGAYTDAAAAEARSEMRLTPEQRTALDLAVQTFSLSPENEAYMIAMMLQSGKQPLKIRIGDNGGNYILASDLTPEQRAQFLGAVPYAKIKGNTAYQSAAKKAAAIIYSLDGGLGEKLVRSKFKATLVERGLLKESDVERDEAGVVKIGAKGPDTGFILNLQGQDVFLSIAEAKLLQMIHFVDNQTFGTLGIQPLVNKDSLPSYQKLFERPYLFDRLEGRATVRTYRQVLEEKNIEIREPFLQQDVPGIDVELNTPATTKQGTAQPGGHGQLGFGFFYNPEAWQPRADGLADILVFTNGDNLNSSNLSPEIIGMMLADKKPVVKLTTRATPIDKKGGKDGVEVIEKEGQVIAYIPQQLEIADAQANKQEPEFIDAGQEAGAKLFGPGSVGNQPFNTNTIIVAKDLLFPMLAKLKSILGSDRYYAEVIAPSLIPKDAKPGKDGRNYRPVDGAIGTVIHNLNEFIMRSLLKEKLGEELDDTDRAVIATIREEGYEKILYFVDVPREFFTPQKNPFDAYMQYLLKDGGYYGLNSTTFTFTEQKEGLVPPLVDIKDSKGQAFDSGKGRYAELQNIIDTFGDEANIQRLRELHVEGDVVLLNATLAGKVSIKNESANVIDLNAIVDLPRANGRLNLADIKIVIDAAGAVTFSARSEARNIYQFPGDLVEADFPILKATLPADHKIYALPLDEANRNRILSDLALLIPGKISGSWKSTAPVYVIAKPVNGALQIAAVFQYSNAVVSPVVVFAPEEGVESQRLEKVFTAFPGTSTDVVAVRVSIPLEVAPNSFQFTIPRLPGAVGFKNVDEVFYVVGPDDDKQSTYSTTFVAAPGDENFQYLQQVLQQARDLAVEPGQIPVLAADQPVFATVVSDEEGNVLAILTGRAPKGVRASEYNFAVLPQIIDDLLPLQTSYIDLLRNPVDDRFPRLPNDVTPVRLDAPFNVVVNRDGQLRPSTLELRSAVTPAGIAQDRTLTSYWGRGYVISELEPQFSISAIQEPRDLPNVFSLSMAELSFAKPYVIDKPDDKLFWAQTPAGLFWRNLLVRVNPEQREALQARLTSAIQAQGLPLDFRAQDLFPLLQLVVTPENEAAGLIFRGVDGVLKPLAAFSAESQGADLQLGVVDLRADVAFTAVQTDGNLRIQPSQRSEARQYVVADFDGLNEGDNLETVVLPRFINRFNDSALKRDIDVNTTPLIVTVETQSGAQVQITVPNFTAHFTSEGLSRAIWNASRTEANGIPVVDKPEDLAFGSWLKSLRVEIATVPSRSTAPVTPVTTPRSEARLNAEQVETIKTLLAQFTLGILSLEKAKLALNELDGEQIRQVAAEVLGVELQVDETQEAGALLDQLLNFAGNADLGFGRVLTERAQGDTVDATRTQNKPVLVTAAGLRYLAKGNARAAVALVEQMEALNVSIVVSMGDDDKKAFFDDLVRDLTKQQSGFSGSQDDMIKMLGKVLDRRNTAELTDFAAKAKVSGQQFAKLDLGLPSDAELSRLDGGYAFELKNGNASLSGKDLWAVAVVGALLPRAVATVENLEAAQAAEKLLEFFNSQQNMGLTFQGGVFKFGTIETLLQAIVTAQYIEIMA